MLSLSRKGGKNYKGTTWKHDFYSLSLHKMKNKKYSEKKKIRTVLVNDITWQMAMSSHSYIKHDEQSLFSANPGIHIV